MKVLHEEIGRTIIRLADGTVLTILEGAIVAKQIPGYRKTERKTIELPDAWIVNDMFKKVYPRCHCNGERSRLD